MYKKRIRGSRKFDERLARARAERERRRLEGPAPERPAELPRLRRRIVIEDYDLGEVVRHEFKLYRSTRVDCYVVEVDGERLPGRMGWSRALELLRKAFVRARAPFDRDAKRLHPRPTIEGSPR